MPDCGRLAEDADDESSLTSPTSSIDDDDAAWLAMKSEFAIYSGNTSD